MTFKYQIGLAGHFNAHRPKLETLLFARTDELGIERAQIVILDDLSKPDLKSPLVVVFFGYGGAQDSDNAALTSLLTHSLVVLPCVNAGAAATFELPPSLRHINALNFDGTDASFARLVSLVLENLRLLRAERRLFISYRRAEAQSIAIQLYERLDAAGFDVFLDTRSVPYGTDFQGILWHRMADSDVVVLLDTPGFRASRWTREELARANATNIQILHLLWPSIVPDSSSAFSEFLSLATADFRTAATLGEDARLTDSKVQDILVHVESLRARALAARHRSLVDNFCDRARDEKARSVAVQPQRFIAVELANGDPVAVVPTIGVPTAHLYHEIERAVQRAGIKAKEIWLLYDERGILESWIEHLGWLDEHLPVVSVQVTKSSKYRAGPGNLHSAISGVSA
jgi:hypothetical protein